jgi:hypothetical protein
VAVEEDEKHLLGGNMCCCSKEEENCWQKWGLYRKINVPSSILQWSCVNIHIQSMYRAWNNKIEDITFWWNYAHLFNPFDKYLLKFKIYKFCYISTVVYRL